jgi:hypothetical protein
MRIGKYENQTLGAPQILSATLALHLRSLLWRVVTVQVPPCTNGYLWVRWPESSLLQFTSAACESSQKTDSLKAFLTC